MRQGTPCLYPSKPATLSFYTDKDRETPVRFVNGIVTSLLQRESGCRRTRWTMVVEPSLVRADLQVDSLSTDRDSFVLETPLKWLNFMRKKELTNSFYSIYISPDKKVKPLHN